MDINKKIAAAAAIAVAVSGVPVTVHAAEKPLNAEYADSYGEIGRASCRERV